jgi:hypothetical protein
MANQENLSNEEILRQQAVLNTIDAKVKAHETLTDSDIKTICPVAFKEKMTKSEIKKLGLSKHYSFVPTSRVINDLRTMGWNPVDAKQVKARKSNTNGYQKHMITFENDSYKTEGATEYPQLLLTNSHDGGNAFTLSAGIFRLVCENGLVIKSEDYGTSRLVHKGYSFKAIQGLVNDFVATIDEAITKITAMKKVELTKNQQMEFAKLAALLRFTEKSYNEDNIADVVDLDDLLSVDRKEDAGDGLWEVYNRVQESIVQGSFHYIGGNKKSRKARPIKNFKQSIDVNKKLSELAFAYV